MSIITFHLSLSQFRSLTRSAPRGTNIIGPTVNFLFNLEFFHCETKNFLKIFYKVIVHRVYSIVGHIRSFFTIKFVIKVTLES